MGPSGDGHLTARLTPIKSARPKIPPGRGHSIEISNAWSRSLRNGVIPALLLLAFKAQLQRPLPETLNNPRARRDDVILHQRLGFLTIACRERFYQISVFLRHRVGCRLGAT